MADSTPKLRLVKDEPLDVLPFERRRGDRRKLAGRVSAVCSYEDKQGEKRQRVCGLVLTDLSAGGLGVASQEALPEGCEITVFLPPYGSEPGRDLAGEVVRCRRDEATWDVGVKLYEQRRATA